MAASSGATKFMCATAGSSLWLFISPVLSLNVWDLARVFHLPVTDAWSQVSNVFNSDSSRIISPDLTACTVYLSHDSRDENAENGPQCALLMLWTPCLVELAAFQSCCLGIPTGI